MVITDKINTLAKQTMYVIIMHTIIYTVYCYAHGQIDPIYTTSSFLPILMFFCLGPLVAVFFLSKQTARQWAIILISLLTAELVFNIYSRFAALSPLAFQKPDMILEIIYEASFGLMLILEVIGFWLTFKILQEIHKQIDSQSGKPIQQP